MEWFCQVERTLTEGRFQFAIKCLHKVMQIKQKNNFAFSPHSIYEGLLLVYFLSTGDLEERLKRILYISKIPKYNLIKYYLLRRDYQPQSKNNASAASSDYDDESRYWTKKKKLKLLLPLKKVISNDPEVLVRNRSPIETIIRINMTIESLVKNDFLDPVRLSLSRDNVELVLMTVLRFNVQKFQMTMTCQSPSNVWDCLDNRKRKSSFYYELNMQVSEFPYKNGNTSLFLFVPASVISGDWMNDMENTENICDLIEKLSTEEGIRELRNLLDSDTTSEDVTNFSLLPTFEVEKNLPIRELLRVLGIEELLKPDAINLYCCHEDKKHSLHLGNAVHRTHVKVTQEDTMACSATVLYTGQVTSLSSQLVVLNNRPNYPFIWLIYDKVGRNVLFVGAFNDFPETPSHY